MGGIGFGGMGAGVDYDRVQDWTVDGMMLPGGIVDKVGGLLPFVSFSLSSSFPLTASLA